MGKNYRTLSETETFMHVAEITYIQQSMLLYILVLLFLLRFQMFSYFNL